MRNIISSIIGLVLIIVVLTTLSPKVRSIVGNIIDLLSQWFNLKGLQKYKDILTEKLKDQFDESKDEVGFKLPEIKLDLNYWFKEIKNLFVSKGQEAFEENIDLTK